MNLKQEKENLGKNSSIGNNDNNIEKLPTVFKEFSYDAN